MSIFKIYCLSNFSIYTLVLVTKYDSTHKWNDIVLVIV